MCVYYATIDLGSAYRYILNRFLKSIIQKISASYPLLVNMILKFSFTLARQKMSSKLLSNVGVLAIM